MTLLAMLNLVVILATLGESDHLKTIFQPRLMIFFLFWVGLGWVGLGGVSGPKTFIGNLNISWWLFSPPIATKKTTQWFINVVKEFLYEPQSQICQGRITKKTLKKSHFFPSTFRASLYCHASFCIGFD
jgi:hypothetical protein